MYNTWTTIKVVMSILTDVCIFVQQSQQNLVSATALQQLEMRRRRWCGLVAEGFESLSTYKSNPTFCDTTFFQHRHGPSFSVSRFSTFYFWSQS